MNGVLIVDKAAGLTSHDVVNRARRILQQRSVGHLGTLDPLATGLLPLVIGNMTRLAQFYLAAEKTYEGLVRFGFSTNTYDAEGKATSPVQAVTLSVERLRQLAAGLCGVIQQTPPPFSAKKIHGVPAHKLARKQQELQLPPVQVEIKECEILSIQGDCASFRARVASGTYMRSVAHDMGRQMGCGAHLAALRRVKSGEFDLAEAHTLEQIESAANAGAIGELFIHPRKLLPQFPAVTATGEAAAHLRNGRAVNLPDLSAARMVKVFEGQSELIAIAARIAGTLFRPKIVLAAGPVRKPGSEGQG
jgi:tRNA pseudouridine55 synthase